MKQQQQQHMLTSGSQHTSPSPICHAGLVHNLYLFKKLYKVDSNVIVRTVNVIKRLIFLFQHRNDVVRFEFKSQHDHVEPAARTDRIAKGQDCWEQRNIQCKVTHNYDFHSFIFVYYVTDKPQL